MTTKIKITLVILVAVVLVALMSFSVWPKHESEEKAAFTTSGEVFKDVPKFLLNSFPETDFSNVDPDIANALSGGPAKDGIPAIDNPTFITFAEYERGDDVQAIVLEDGNQVKIYPYNILIWHEIVNDIANGVPVAITFCPLCGSAIVFDRRLEVGESTFGVSGGLLESNMIMYDRLTESLWQQSTGKTLAGELHPSQLELFPFQLLNMGEVREKYPEALILSEDTGHRRNYARNPYTGYNENNNTFLFPISEFGPEFDSKEIMVVFRVGDVTAATPWLTFLDGSSKDVTVNEVELTLEKNDGELTITDQEGTIYPFFFEMWFSFVVQNPDGVVIE